MMLVDVKPCVKCGAQDRYDNGAGRCRPCLVASKAAWYRRNRDEILAQVSRRQQANREQYLAYQRRYRADHLEEHRAADRLYAQEHSVEAVERARRWQEAHPFAVKAHRAKTKAQRRKAAGHHTGVQLRARWAMFGDRCWMCKAPAEVTDHVIALARGGSNWASNLRPACHSCNRWKSAKPLAHVLAEHRNFVHPTSPVVVKA